MRSVSKRVDWKGDNTIYAGNECARFHFQNEKKKKRKKKNSICIFNVRKHFQRRRERWVIAEEGRGDENKNCRGNSTSFSELVVFYRPLCQNIHVIAWLGPCITLGTSASFRPNVSERVYTSACVSRLVYQAGRARKGQVWTRGREWELTGSTSFLENSRESQRPWNAQSFLSRVRCVDPLTVHWPEGIICHGNRDERLPDYPWFLLLPVLHTNTIFHLFIAALVMISSDIFF